MDETTIALVAWELAALRRGLIPQPHGGALMPGGGYRPRAGRPKSRVKMALEQAKGDPLRQAKLAGQFIRDESLPVAELFRAGNFLLDLVRRLERKPRKRKRSTFRVVRATAAELAARESPKMELTRFGGHRPAPPCWRREVSDAREAPAV